MIPDRNSVGYTEYIVREFLKGTRISKIASSLGVSTRAISSRIQYIRKLGVKLPLRIGPVSQIDVDGLNKIIQGAYYKPEVEDDGNV